MSKLLHFRHLHPLVYFVADKPTKDNVSPTIPLVGTTSYKRLLEWIGEMNIDITRVRMYNQADNPFNNPLSIMSLNRAITLDQIRVVALGQKAATYLTKTGIKEHFILPHPSGKNRLLNNQEFVKMKLIACQNYIYQGAVCGIEKFEKADA